MFLHELPAVLGGDIITEAASEMELYDICRFREVNRFFEGVATKAIADNWIYNKLTAQNAQDMPDQFRKRIIKLFIGDQDRGVNGLRRLIHEVAQYLSDYMASRTKEQWLEVLLDGLNRCKLCNSLGEPIETGRYIWHAEWRDSRLDWHREDPEKHRLQIRMTSFMFAVLAEDEELQDKILSDGIPINDVCYYLYSPLGMASRLGLRYTVSKLLDAGAEYRSDRDVEPNFVPHPLLCAIESNHADIVKLLLEAADDDDEDDYSLRDAASIAAKNNNREILEHILAVNLRMGAVESIKAAALNGWDDMLKRLLVRDTYWLNGFWSNDNIGAPIVYAAEGGNLSTCQLIQSKALLNDCDRRRNTGNLLRAAASGGNVEVLEFVLHEQLDDTCPDHLPVVAATKGHVDMLNYLLDNGYHLKRKKSRELIRYALFAGIYSQRCGAVELLVQRLKMDLNIEHIKEGDNLVVPLIAAVDSGSSDMVAC
ncbi:hypothetical protein HBH98_052250 [Parastagonospora nodorum]|nr:hypothetical protein HBH43_157170 [Parastagonospora nodorum]KAH4215192.1 hypothetical protein HBI95_018430 [Parastagonospora nodorum]KAH4350676.1 hypothetical protein HBH98_052250 [Parastagonospora nodorum]KAH4363007.1 hypothetical protein HBH97_188240 [Parastagonospora nodorum]KAH4424569.1 hypothetical protein HBH99_039820 [Parastagonospora nodorum]